MPDSPPEFAGTIVITWPQLTPNGSLPGWGITLTDAETGEDIQTVTAFRVVLHADAQDLVWAELDMFAGADGKPVYSHPLHVVDGEPVRGTFPFLVTEMRVAPPAEETAAAAKLAALRAAVQTVLDDEESQHPGGWGPDITMVGVLRDAMEATAP